MINYEINWYLIHMIHEIFKPPIEQAEEEARIRNAKLEELKRRRWLIDGGDADADADADTNIDLVMEMVVMLVQTTDGCKLKKGGLIFFKSMQWFWHSSHPETGEPWDRWTLIYKITKRMNWMSSWKFTKSIVYITMKNYITLDSNLKEGSWR